MNKIQQSELLQEVERLGQIGGWSFYPNSNRLLWTDQLYSIFELPRTCPIDPKFIYSFFKGESSKIFKSAFEACYIDHVPFQLRLPIRTYSRKTKWVVVQGRAVVKGGVCVKVLGALQDITEITHLSKEVDNYNTLSYELFSIFNIEGCWIQASQNWKESIGVAPDDLIGKELWQFVLDEDRARFQGALWDQIKKGNLWNFESRLKTVTGHSKWFSWNILYDKEDQLFYATCRNVDDLILKQKNLQDNLQRTLDTIRAQDEFLSLVSHELRTPLVPILGYCQLLKDDIEDKETLASLEEIEKAGRNLEGLIQEILELSQIKNGQPIVRFSRFSLFDLLNNLVSRQLKQFHQKGISINIVENDTLESIKNISLISDVKRIQKILERFISNAQRFTEQGGALLIVEPGSEEGWFRVTVQDSGEGISAYDREKVFQAFHQKEAPDQRKHSGLGIGLTIVKQLAEHIDGRIGFKSHLGAGSSFWLEFENLELMDLE